MINNNFPFEPFFLFKKPLIQTLMGWFLNISPEPTSSTSLIDLPDQDKLALEITTPESWKSTDPTIVMVHGLCGSHKSTYLIKLTKKLKNKNVRSIRINLRGCGSGKDFAKSTYHCGKSDDILEALKFLKKESPESPMILVGFSLGGNLVLKMVGELKEKALNYVKKVIALSPPIDLKSSANLFEAPENKVYLRYFTNLLRKDLKDLKKRIKEFPSINFPKNMTMRDFNSLFVIPFFGFKDTEDYYRQASAKYVISEIKVPCKVLLSKDDPLVAWEIFNELMLPQNFEVYITENGGHLGYIGNFKKPQGFYWLYNVLLEWIFN